jgi:hypothetical protein
MAPDRSCLSGWRPARRHFAEVVDALESQQLLDVSGR